MELLIKLIFSALTFAMVWAWRVEQDSPRIKVKGADKLFLWESGLAIITTVLTLGLAVYAVRVADTEIVLSRYMHLYWVAFYAVILYGQLYIVLTESKKNTRKSKPISVVCGVCGVYWVYQLSFHLGVIYHDMVEHGVTKVESTCMLYTVAILAYLLFIRYERNRVKPRKWFVVLCICGLVAAVVQIGLAIC